MSEEAYSEIQAHIHFAKLANNEVWKFLELKHRTPEDDRLMLAAAHTSSFHWRIAGTGAHMQRSLWLLARVYTVLEIGELALIFAVACQEATEESADELSDFDFAYSNEALARAYSLNDAQSEAAEYLERARELGEQIKDAEDRDIFLSDLEAEPWRE